MNVLFILYKIYSFYLNILLFSHVMKDIQVQNFSKILNFPPLTMKSYIYNFQFMFIVSIYRYTRCNLSLQIPLNIYIYACALVCVYVCVCVYTHVCTYSTPHITRVHISKKKDYMVCICFSIATNLYHRKILYLNSSLHDYIVYKVLKKMHFIGQNINNIFITTNFNNSR